MPKDPEKTIEQTEARFSAVFNQSFLIQILANIDGKLGEINKTTMELCGYPREELIGKELWLCPWWLPDRTLSGHIKPLFEQALVGQVVQFSSDCFVAKGERRQAEFTLTPIFNSSGEIEAILASGLDVTERKRKEISLIEQNRILEAIATGAPLSEILEAIMRQIESQLPGIMSAVCSVDKAKRHLHPLASRGLPTAFITDIEEIEIRLDQASSGAGSLEAQAGLIGDNANDWIEQRQLALSHGLKSCWFFSIFSRCDQLLGAFALYAADIRRLGDAELGLIRSLANIARIAIERDVLFKAQDDSEAFGQAIFLAASAGIALFTINGVFLTANPAYCSALGYTEVELQGLDVMCLAHSDDLHIYREKLEELLAGKCENFIIEKKHHKKDNDVIWIRSSVSLMGSERGNTKNIIVVIEDITSAKLAETTLLQTQSLLKKACEIAHFGGWLLTLPDMTLVWSDELAAIHGEPAGFSPSVEQGLNYYAPEYRDRVKYLLLACIHEGIAFDEELEIFSKQGRRLWVRTIGQAIKDSSGKTVQVQGAFQDISEQKKADQEKQETLGKLQKIAGRLPGVIYEFRLRPDGTACMPYASEFLRNVFGLAPADVATDATPVFAKIHPDDLDAVRASIEYSALHLAPWRHEFRLKAQNGEITWVSANSLPQKESDGSVLWYGFVTDVTELRKSHEQLKLLEMSISRLNDIVMITEADDIDESGPQIVFVNDAFVRLTGYTRKEALASTPRLLQGPKTQRFELDRIKAAMKKWEPIRSQLINYTKSGEEYWLELDIAPVTDSSENLTHFIAIERDITERKHAELELSRLNRALQMNDALRTSIIHASSETALLNETCQLAIDIGGYSSAWIGYAHDDPEQTIEVVAVRGSGIEYINNIKLSWSASVESGLGPAGRTVRIGLPLICRDLEKEEPFRPWFRNWQQFGFSGVVCLPLRDQHKTFGLLTFYFNDDRTLAAEEVKLLQSLVDELAFGIIALRAQEYQQKVQSAVMKVAASVSTNADLSILEQLTRNLAEALDANGAFIAVILPGQILTARTVSAVVDGQVIDNFDYVIAGTPCENLLQENDCVINGGVNERYPLSASLQKLGAQTYVGQALLNSSAQTTGLMFLIFRSPLKDISFVSSTLKIFAARAASELERQNAYAQIHQQASLLDKAQDAIIVRGLNHEILFWNKSAERLYGWTETEAKQCTLDKLIYDDATEFYKVTKSLLKKGEWSGEITQQRKDGTQLTVEGHWTLVCDDDGKAQSILAINTDITARKIAKEKIEQLAFYDPLTQLPNRQLFIDRLKQIMVTVSRTNKNGALLFIDLDNFKSLNDTQGHDVGDQLLKEVAVRLTLSTRKSDTVARLGGDEFVVILSNLSKDMDEAAIQAKRITEKLQRSIKTPYQLSGNEYYCTSSIGITIINEHSSTIDEILKQADLAMYQSKAEGRNTLCFYDAEMQNAVVNKVALEAEIRQSLQRKEFSLHYQSQVNSDGQIIGAEALIRWQHPQRGMVSPGEFIPLAEETRLIIPMGNWVLETACSQLAKWSKKTKFSNLTLAVNVSVFQFRQPSFIEDVLHILKISGANAHNLKLEITESMLVDDVEDFIYKISTLKAKGIGFSLDDFGTGYSSLAYLKRLPLDQLKIDQSFVRDILIDPNDASIACTVVALAHGLGLSVIAEGVETAAQREFLLQNHCLVYQGYFFSKPLPIEKFEAYFLKNDR